MRSLRHSAEDKKTGCRKSNGLAATPELAGMAAGAGASAAGLVSAESILLDGKLRKVNLVHGILAKNVVERRDQFGANDVSHARFLQVIDRFTAQNARSCVAKFSVVCINLRFEIRLFPHKSDIRNEVPCPG